MHTLRHDLNMILSGDDWWRFALLWAILLAGSAIELFSLMAVPLFTGVLLGAAGNSLSGLFSAFSRLLCRLCGDSPPTALPAAAILLLALNLLRMLWAASGYYLQGRFLANRRIALASRLLRLYTIAPPSFRRAHSRLDLINRAANESEHIVNGFIGNGLLFLQHCATSLAVCGLLFWSAPLLTATALAAITLFVGGYLLARRKRLGSLSRIDLAARTSAQIAAGNALDNADEALLSGHRTFFTARFHAGMQQTAAASARNLFHIQVVWPYLEFVSLLTLLGVTFLSLSLNHGDAAAAATQLSLLGVALVRIRSGAINLVTTWTQAQFNRCALKVVAADLRRFTSAADENAIVREDALPPAEFTRELTAEHLTFKYDNSGRPVLADLSFTLRRGESLGIAGSTGCGKSTLLRLIAGLERPAAGTLLLDGRPLDTPEALTAWQHAIGCVPQKITLFEGTVADNIAFGLAPQERDGARLASAVAEAHLCDFVNSLPLGLETPLGEHGCRLSGGQLQRIGIARALYRNPALLLFDEATSALDNHTESLLTATLEQMHGRRTMVTVAHRLSTLRHCDRILFLAEGRIAAQGTYRELLQTCPDFAAMASRAEISTSD